MQGEPEVHKKGLFASGCLKPSVPPDFTLDLGFIGSRQDGKPGFRSSTPPPDRAERVGSQRRVSDGARRPRLRAAPRSLPAWEILLIPPLHGPALRSVWSTALFLCVNGEFGLKNLLSKLVDPLLSEAYVLHIANLGNLEALWDEQEFIGKGNCSDYVGIWKLAIRPRHLKRFYVLLHLMNCLWHSCLLSLMYEKCICHFRLDEHFSLP